MTGYGNAQLTFESKELTVEIHGLNRKGLELQIRLPEGWQALESIVSQQLKKHITRGRIVVSIELNQSKSAKNTLWDIDQVLKIVKNLQQLADQIPIIFNLTGDTLFQIAHSTRQYTSTLNVTDTFITSFESLIQQALVGFNHMRLTEGAYLKADFELRLNLLNVSVCKMESLAHSVVPQYRNQLLERLRKLDLTLDPNDERVLKELAFVADRADITEELTRLRSHILQFTELMQSHDSVGRKLDFICQECMRELTTIGNKANLLEIIQLVMNAKNEVERIREQVQNIE